MIIKLMSNHANDHACRSKQQHQNMYAGPKRWKRKLHIGHQHPG
ncbi:hypothetical protein [Nitrosomonas sp. JL21]|nr:hypothetical protein [Nitrosomonas sp. JL21]